MKNFATSGWAKRAGSWLTCSPSLLRDLEKIQNYRRHSLLPFLLFENGNRWVMLFFLAFLLLDASGCQLNEIPIDPRPKLRGNVLLKVYLVRHGESKKNVAHLPWTPEEQLDTLTTKGREQAAAIGHFLKDKDIVAIQSSPTGRTRETANAIGQVIGLKEGYEVDPAFASLRGGKSQDGNQISWAWREKQWALGQDPRPEGGESLSDGEFRAKGSLNKLVEKFPEKSVVIVSHGDICAALLGYAANTPMPKRFVTHDVPTGSVSEFIMTNTGWHIFEEGREAAELVPIPLPEHKDGFN